MRTDAHFYQIFRQMPEMLYRLSGLPSPGPCVMRTATVKAIHRSMDGLIVPQQPEQPLCVVEVQMQGGAGTFPWQRLVIEVAGMEMEHYPREVQGLLIFGTRRSDPGSARWSGSVRAVYLDEAIAALARREPEHVLLSVFRPLLEPDDAALEKSAAADYHRITQTKLPGVNPEQLAAIFLDWLSQRFKTRTPKQIAAMIAELTPIEETAVGRELIGIGLRRGRRAGLERGLERGMQQGMQQGMQTARGILSTMLKARFPKISAAVLQEAGALPAPAMQQLAAEVMQLPNVAALKAWLARQQ